MAGVHHKGYVAGGPQMVARLAALRRSLSNVLLATATAAGAKVIADEWRTQARARIGIGPGTAHFVEAIGFRASPGENGATAYVGLSEAVQPSPGEAHPREYAAVLEFGSSDTPARPTLRPAFDASRARALEEMANVLRQLLERV